MYRFYVDKEAVQKTQILLSGEDYNHIRNVLRMKQGEEITVCDGQGTDYRCVLEGFLQNQVSVRILSAAAADTELPIQIVLFQGLPKKDKMEFVIQKAVELGAFEIIPMATARTIVKLEDAKREQKKRERWQAVAKAAAMQSMRGRIPKVGSVLTFSKALEYAAKLDMLLIPYEHAQNIQQTREVLKSIHAKSSVGVFIGPEGGFSPEEISLAEAAKAKPITLGRRILRTETAGMTALSLLMFEAEYKA